MKKYFKMKYEQFLIRLFDWVMKLMNESEVSWYPKHVIGADYEKKIEELEDCNMDLERETDKLYYYLVNRDQMIAELQEKLDYYEPWKGEDTTR